MKLHAQSTNPAPSFFTRSTPKQPRPPVSTQLHHRAPPTTSTNSSPIRERAERDVLEGKLGNDGGAYLVGFSMPHDGLLELKKRGYNVVVGAIDLVVFRSVLADDVKKFKMSDGGDDCFGDLVQTVEGQDADEKCWSNGPTNFVLLLLLL